MEGWRLENYSKDLGLILGEYSFMGNEPKVIESALKNIFENRNFPQEYTLIAIQGPKLYLNRSFESPSISDITWFHDINSRYDKAKEDWTWYVSKILTPHLVPILISQYKEKYLPFHPTLEQIITESKKMKKSCQVDFDRKTGEPKHEGLRITSVQKVIKKIA